MPLLEVKDLCRAFRQGDTEIHAVDHVCFSVEQGDMLAIVGQSGSGKTTLLNLLGCIDKPSAGHVLLDGQDIHSLSDKESAKLRRQKIGYIYQDFKLLPILTAKENILVPAMLDGGKLPMPQVRPLADRLGIGNRLNHLPSQLSGGQRQRVAIARALINQPSILLGKSGQGLRTGDHGAAAGFEPGGTYHHSGNAQRRICGSVPPENYDQRWTDYFRPVKGFCLDS